MITLKKTAMFAGALGIAAATAVGSLSPAWAAAKAKQTRAAAQASTYGQTRLLASEPRAFASEPLNYGMMTVPYAYASPYSCATDDGYGRWTSCDTGQ
jgi:hypothetical protein